MRDGVMILVGAATFAFGGWVAHVGDRRGWSTLQQWVLMLAFGVAVALAVQTTAHAQTCTATGKLCASASGDTSQYAPCCAGSTCANNSGWHCMASATTTTTVTTQTTVTQPPCTPAGKQPTMQPCCDGLMLGPKTGVSGNYCLDPTVTTVTTRPATTVTTTTQATATTVPGVCTVATAGKACNAQALCCPPLLCIPNPNGSDYCGSVGSTTPSPTPSPASFPVAACRPNGIDLSARWSDGSWLNYANMSGVPHVASNGERDCMENALKNRLVELIEMAGDLAPTAANKARDCRTLVDTRIGVVSPYEGALQSTNGGVWFVPAFGRHYQCEQHVLNDFRNALVASGMRATAAARFAGAGFEDLRNLLDVDPTFTGRASFPTKSVPAVTTARANAFQVDTRTTLAACGNGDCSTLHATHEAHACVTAARCGQGSIAACPLVGVMHTIYENGCGGDERCLAFRKMKPFRGTEDVAHWTRTQLCQLARLQDREHMRWMQAQEAGDWAASRKADANHSALHDAMNDGSDRAHYTYSCEAPASAIIECFGGDQPMSALLPKLVAAYGVN